MDRKQYRHEAASIDGFIAQVVRYVASGHYFYVRVIIPARKEPDRVDRKLLDRYDIEKPSWRRERRRLKKSAGIHYLRHDRLAVLMLTRGRHDDFYADHARSVTDIRRKALKAFGYSIRFGYCVGEKRSKVFVRLDENRYRDLRNHFLTIGVWNSCRKPELLEREFSNLPVQAYRPVFEQLLAIAKQVNRARRRRGFAPINLNCVPCRVWPTKVFVEENPVGVPQTGKEEANVNHRADGGDAIHRRT